MLKVRTLALLIIWPMVVLSAAGYAADPRYSDQKKLERLQTELVTRKMGELLEEFKKQNPNVPPPSVAQMIRVVEEQTRNPDPDAQRAAWDQLLDLYRKWLSENENNYKERLVYRFKFSNALQGAAEEYINAILLRGGTPADYTSLNKLADEQVKLLTQNVKLFKEIDQNANEGSPKPEQIEELDKKSEYLISQDWDSAWAKFYLALSLSNDPAKAEECKKLAEESAAAMKKVYNDEDPNSNFLDKPHAETGMQYQAKLLYGMNQRLLGNWEEADKAFDFVIHAESPLTDNTANVLKFKARIEQVKVERDRAKSSADLDKAATDVAELIQWINTTSLGKQPIFKVVCLLLQTNVLSKKAELARKEGKTAEVAKLREQAFQPLADFAKTNPDQLGVLNEEVFKLLAGEDDPKKLSSFELQAKVAVHLPRAYAIEDDKKLDEKDRKAKAVEEYKKLISFAEELRSRDDEIAKGLKATVLFNLSAAYNGLAAYDPQYRFQSAQTFYDLVEADPKDANAQRSLEQCLEILSDMRRDKENPTQVDALFPKAIKLLVEKFPTSEYNKLANFDYAESKRIDTDNMAVDRTNDKTRMESSFAKSLAYREAANLYAKVPPEHPAYHRALSWKAMVLLASLENYAPYSRDQEEIKKRADEVVQASLQANAKLMEKATSAKTPEEKTRFMEQAANTLISAAGAFMRINNPQQAMDVLKDFEKKYPDSKDVIGQALQIRMNALQKLGKNREAAALIDDYLQFDPEGAGRVIGSLLGKAQEDYRKAKAEGKDPQELKMQAKDVKELASKMYDWAEKNQQSATRPKGVTPKDLHGYKYAKAQAYLAAAEGKDDYGVARKLFEEMAKQRAEEGAKYQPDLDKAKEELRLLNLQDPNNDAKRKELNDKITELRVKVEPEFYQQKGIADATMGMEDWESAAKLYKDLRGMVTSTDPRYFEVVLNGYKANLGLADSKSGEEKDKARQTVASDLDRLLKIDTSKMGGTRGEFEALLVQAGGAPAISTAPTGPTTQQLAEQAKEDADIKQKEAEQRKKMLIAFGIFAVVALGLGILSWRVFKRENKYLKSAHPHLKEPLHHGELPLEDETKPVDILGTESKGEEAKPQGGEPKPEDEKK